MKILLVHNFYGSEAPSGENQVFEAEKNLLIDKGHEVEVFTRSSDEIRNKGLFGILRGALSVIWNPFSKIAIQKKINKFKPDIVHVHNTFPLISPSIFYFFNKKIPKVLTLHNYRLLCSAGIPMRNNSVCTQCIDKKSILPALKYKCYRKSRLATLPIALNIEFHRIIGTWETKVDAFIVLSDFQKKKLSAGGINSSKIHVKPNFYAGKPPLVPYNIRSNYAVFVGRLSDEKGIKTLVDAWVKWGNNAPELRIVGDGPLNSNLQLLAKNVNIKFLGQVSFEHTQFQISRSKLLILPSECYEGFPMVIREAFALGTPVAVSNLGPLPTIVKDNVNGVIFEPWQPDSLLNVVKHLWNSPDELSILSKGARTSFETLYNEEANYIGLTNIYKAAMKKLES